MGLRSRISQYLEKLASKAGVTEDDMIKDIQGSLKDPKDLADEVVKRYKQTFEGEAPESEAAKTLKETLSANTPQAPAPQPGGALVPLGEQGLVPQAEKGLVPQPGSGEQGIVPLAEKVNKSRAMPQAPLMLEGEVLGAPSPKAPMQSSVPPSKRPLTAEDLREPEQPKMSLSKKVGAGVAAGLGAGGAGLSLMDSRKGGEAVASPEETKAEASTASSTTKGGKVKTGNKTIDTLVNNSSKIKSPDDLESLWNQANSLADKMSPINKELYEGKLAELKEERKAAEALYKERANRTEWAEVAETLGHAFAQLGAAAHGLQTGVDLSGLKFNKTDWSKKFDRLMAELKNTKESIKGEEGLLADSKKERDRMAESLYSQLIGEKKQKASQEFSEGQQKRQQAFQAGESEKDRASRERAAALSAGNKGAAQEQKGVQQQLGALNSIETSLSNLGTLSKKQGMQELQNMKKEFAKVPGFNVEEYNQFIKDYEKGWFGASKETAINTFKTKLQNYKTKLGKSEEGTVLLRNPEGGTSKVPASEVERALKAGYTRMN